MITESTYHRTKLKQSCAQSFFSTTVEKIALPMLAHRVRDIGKARFPSAVEIKYDGIRAIVTVKDERASIQTRDGKDYTSRFSNLAYHLGNLADGVYDGEIYSPKHPGSDMALRSTLRGEVIFRAFDLPLSKSKYLRRRFELMEKIVQGSRIRLSKIVGFAKDLREAVEMAGGVIRDGEEGIVLKPVDGRYHVGERREWNKIKLKEEE